MQKKLKPRYQSFEQTFVVLLKEAKRRPISIHRFLTILSGHGKVLLLIFLSLGFVQIPGIAIVLGCFIAYLGLRIALGKSVIWIPQFLRDKKISSSLLIKVIKQTLHILKFIERWSWPRYVWATQKSITRVCNGSMIALVGLCLAICPPIPLTGLFACVAIFLIGVGLLNDDGIYIILGYVAALVYLVTVMIILNYFSMTAMIEWFKNIIHFHTV
jgi:hypothetical protein